jgi:hypothetical protein
MRVKVCSSKSMLLATLLGWETPGQEGQNPRQTWVH